MRTPRLAPLAAALCVVAAVLAIACADTATTRAIAPTTAQTDPANGAALLPPRVTITLPIDSAFTGDTVGGVLATATDFSGKVQNQARIVWGTRGVDSAPGSVTIAGVNPKAQQVTLRGITRGRLMLVASYTDRFGQTVSDSARFHVAPRTATIGICLLDPHIADSLGIKGDTTVDYGIVGPFCLQNDTLYIPHPTPTPGMDTTKASPNLIPNLIPLGGSLLDAKVQVRVHILRADRR